MVLWNSVIWRAGSWVWVMDRRANSVTVGLFGLAPRFRMLSWMSGASRRSIMICVTRARETPSRRAMVAWLATSSASSCRLHSRALRSVSTTGGVRGSRGGFGGLGAYRGGGTAFTTRLAGTRRIRVPMLPFSNAPAGPSATSTVCWRSSAEPLTWSADTWIMRNQTSGMALRDLPREPRGASIFSGNFPADIVNGKPRSFASRGFSVTCWSQRVMDDFGLRRNSRFRSPPTGVRSETYTFRLGIRKSSRELSGSLLNRPLWVNNSVRLGPHSEIELVGSGGVAWA